jgi:hypothetical protein
MRGPEGNNESSPRPKARRFSITFSAAFSAPATFSAVVVIVYLSSQRNHHKKSAMLGVQYDLSKNDHTKVEGPPLAGSQHRRRKRHAHPGRRAGDVILNRRGSSTIAQAVLNPLLRNISMFIDLID